MIPAPDAGPKMEEYIECGLAVVSSAHTRLQFSDTWNVQDIDAWFRKLFPKPFAWLDAICPPVDGQYQWKVMGKYHKRLYAMDSKSPTDGNTLNRAKGSGGRAFKDTVIHIGEYLFSDMTRGWLIVVGRQFRLLRSLFVFT